MTKSPKDDGTLDNGVTFNDLIDQMNAEGPKHTVTFDQMAQSSAIVQEADKGPHQIPESTKFVLVGDMICIEVDECTCAAAGLLVSGHEPYCGIEPMVRFREIRNADVLTEFGVQHAPGHYWTYADEDVAKRVAKEHEASVSQRFLLRSRF